MPRLVGGELHWQEVLKSAFWHGIAPLLYKNLKGIRETPIPKDFMDQLRKTYHGPLARNMYIYSEMDRILEAFHKNDIGAIVLKGAALAKTVYGDIGLRPMGDIDLLVKREDLPRAEKVLFGLGYTYSINNPDHYKENHYHISYIHPDRNIPVEIHWHISQKSHPFRIRNIGGRRGQLFALTIRAIHVIGSKIDSIITTLLRPAYYWLASSGIFRQWLPARIKPRVLSFNSPAGKELQLVMGQHVVGRRLAGKNQWWIKRPFRLFIDESSLPNNNTFVED